MYDLCKADVIHTAVCIKKVGNDAHARPCANSNPNLGRVPCLVCLYVQPAVCVVTMFKQLQLYG